MRSVQITSLRCSELLTSIHQFESVRQIVRSAIFVTFTNMIRWLLLLVVIASGFCESSANAFLSITISNGTEIRGRVEQTLYTNRKYVSFRGIPYAKPPVGELRFKVIKLCAKYWVISSLYLFLFKVIYKLTWFQTHLIS